MKRFIAVSSVALALALVSTASAYPGGKCDPDMDDVVTMADLLIIRAANGELAVDESDPRDGNNDTRINVADVRFCQLRLGTTPPPPLA